MADNNLTQSMSFRRRIFRWLSTIGLVILIVVLGLMIIQHKHYMDARLNAVQDYQEAFHDDLFHVLTFVRAGEDQDFMVPLANLVQTAQDTEGTLIYAGQVIHMALRSQQITETFGPSVDWHAILVQQFEDQDAYRSYLNRTEITDALAQFDVTYTHGFKRSAIQNVLLHQMLLVLKIWRQVTFSPDILPFQPSPDLEGMSSDESLALKQQAKELGKDALLVVNLAREGTAEEQAANESYSFEMLGLMADVGYGPMHMATTVSLEHDHQFDSAMLVYYPGVEYFSALSGSTWFQGIRGDKQLADTQACMTVPITNILLGQTGY